MFLVNGYGVYPMSSRLTDRWLQFTIQLFERVRVNLEEKINEDVLSGYGKISLEVR